MREEDDNITEPLASIAGVFTDLGEAKMVPPQWVIKDLLPEGLVFVGAPPKSYKSTVTVAAAGIVAGLEVDALPAFMSEAVETGPVLMFSYEATAGELREILEVGMGVKVPANESILVVDDPWSFRLDDPDGLKQILYWLDARKPKLVVLDPLRDFHNLDEKDSGDMNRLLRPLQKWAKDNHACCLIVHHTSKKRSEDGRPSTFDAQDLRGTGALFGIADGVLMFSPIGHFAVQIAATFKRARGWEKKVQLKAYDALAPASEFLTQMDRSVLRSLEAGLTSSKDIALQLRAGTDQVKEALEKLARNGLIPWPKKEK